MSQGIAPSMISLLASRWRAPRMRLPTKPGQTPTSTAILPILRASFMQVLITSFEVWSARTISSSFITLAGEKKCRPITASGRLVTEAISSMFSPEVLVARIAPRLADRVELGEHVLLDVHPLEHGLDDEVAVGQRGSGRASR